MSADNWGMCPVCQKRANDDLATRMAAAAELYGKVPAEEWMATQTKAAKPVKLEYTLREDYEIGLGEDGRFYATYGGSCDVCGLEHRHKFEQQLDLGSISAKLRKKS